MILFSSLSQGNILLLFTYLGLASGCVFFLIFYLCDKITTMKLNHKRKKPKDKTKDAPPILNDEKSSLNDMIKRQKEKKKEEKRQERERKKALEKKYREERKEEKRKIRQEKKNIKLEKRQKRLQERQIKIKERRKKKTLKLAKDGEIIARGKVNDLQEENYQEKEKINASKKPTAPKKMVDKSVNTTKKKKADLIKKREKEKLIKKHEKEKRDILKKNKKEKLAKIRKQKREKLKRKLLTFIKKIYHIILYSLSNVVKTITFAAVILASVYINIHLNYGRINLICLFTYILFFFMARMMLKILAKLMLSIYTIHTSKEKR